MKSNDVRLCFAQDNPGYDKLFNFYLDNKYQLRYTGGMVPDVNQVRFVSLLAQRLNSEQNGLMGNIRTSISHEVRERVCDSFAEAIDPLGTSDAKSAANGFFESTSFAVFLAGCGGA